MKVHQLPRVPEGAQASPDCMPGGTLLLCIMDPEAEHPVCCNVIVALMTGRNWPQC